MTKDQAGAEHEHVAPTEEWHRVTLLTFLKTNTPTHYICACGATEPLQIYPQPYVELDPHSNAAHEVDMGTAGTLDAIVRDHNSRGKLLAALEQTQAEFDLLVLEPNGDVVLAPETWHMWRERFRAAIAESRGERAGT